MQDWRTKPKISPVVQAWKGNFKLGGLFAIGFTAVVAFLHHMVAGPNQVKGEDEANAERLSEGNGT